MTTRMIENQRRAYEARARDDLNRCASSWANLCEAQKFAMLARLAKAAAIPCELTLLGVEGDDTEVARLLDGRLDRGPNRNEWSLGGGLGSAHVHMLPREEPNQ